jgi:PEP-CTERM motif
MMTRTLLALFACTAFPCAASAGDLWVQGTGPESSGLSPAGTATTSLGSFNVVINAGTALQSNAPALAAFERAAATWESYISDPVTVNISANVLNLGSSSILGQASSVILAGGHDLIRNAMVSDSSGESDDSVVSLLPTAAQMSFTTAPGMTYAGNIAISKANAKALGFTGLDSIFGASDATIEFNSAFAFDYDRSDGIAPGTFDFESVALHEIGHALGFLSAVDDVDSAVSQSLSIEVQPTTLDLFRFALGSGNPATALDFTTGSRNLQPGSAAIFDDLSLEAGFSTGVATGDGRQASHWKDNGLTGVLIGSMDPTIAPQQVFLPSGADLRAFDLIGWDIVSVPEPASVLLLSLGGLLLGVRRRR